jgi:mono/diheme cytochrome c family protein
MRSDLRRVALLGTFALTGLALLGCPRDEAPPPVAEEPAEAPVAEPAPAVELPEGYTQEMVAEGQQLFTSTAQCFTCHGMDGSGTTLAPNLRDGRWINMVRGDMAEIETLIRTGVETPVEYPAPMPPMGGVELTDEQVRALAAYVFAISRGG